MSLVAACIGSVLMTSLIVGIFISLWHILKHAKFRFVLILSCLLIMSDASLGILSVCFYFEGHVSKNSVELTISSLIGVFTFFFNFCNLTLHWLFSMKYWMVSRVVPKLFEGGRDIKFNEKTFRMVNLYGVIFTFTICLTTAYYRAKLTYESSNESAVSDSLVETVQILLWAVNGCELVATLVMVDALRRIQKSVKENPFLESNSKTMCLHICMSFMHIISYSTTIFFAIRAYGDP
mmetsp:Transcript_24994/g.31213  ORF Transcript_24994/g.31213 Transcript_24994/m.31213 type:complete len:236 (+) Transcript_24994:44-751(+)